MPSFFSPNALESMRASGYKNTQYALAELVDNSFDAEASTVKIIFFEKRANGKKYIDEIIVCDDGKGMDDSQLQVCLQFGFTGNPNLEEIVKRKKKGKYGFGLPNASISQSPDVHVFSKHKSKKYKTTFLSLEQIKNQNTIEIPDVREVDLPEHYQQAGAMLNEKQGTIVAWRNCDRLSNTRAEKIIEKSERLLGQIYRYLLSGDKQIVLEAWEHNSKQNNFKQSHSVSVLPNDPLFLMPNTFIARILDKASKENSGIQDHSKDPATYYKKFAVSARKCKPTNEELTDHSYPFTFRWRGKDYYFKIRTSYAKVDIQKPGIREGGNTAVGQFYGDKKSITFVRADREIVEGNFGFYKETERRNRWWTIEVQFNADADDLLGVSNNKQGISFVYTASPDDKTEQWDSSVATLQQAREQLWVELSQKIEDARKVVFKEYVLRKHKEWEIENTATDGPGGGGGIPGATDETIQATRKTDGKRESQFQPQQREALLKRLQEKYPAVSKAEINQAINNFDDSRVKGCMLYCPSEANTLWSITSVFGFLIILVNTEHEFYKRIIHPFRNHAFKAPLSAIELFISSLAWEEFHFGDTEEHKSTLESFRTYMGLHLNRYLKENNIEVSDSDLQPIDDATEAEEG
jgi:hypothetical protein